MPYKGRAAFTVGLIGVLSVVSAGYSVDNRNSNKTLQQSTDTNNKKTLTAVQQQALALLDPLFLATGDLEDGMMKVYIQAQIANALWEYDVARARHRFEDIFRTIKSIEGQRPAIQSPWPSNPAYQLRADVLARILECDRAWARQLALNFLSEPRQNKTDFQMLNWILPILAETDPQGAARIIKQSIDRKEGIRFEDTLEKIRQKDSLLAADLFSYAFIAGPDEGSTPLEHFRALLYYFSRDAGDSDTTTLNPDLLKRFVEFGYHAYMREADEIEQESKERPSLTERAWSGHMDVVAMMPLLTRLMPDLAPKILARWDAAILTREGGKELIRQDRIMDGSISVQEMLNNAEQATDRREKQALYRFAAEKSSFAGEFDQAFSLINRMDKDEWPELEQGILVDAAKSAIASGNVDTGYDRSKQVKDLRERVRLLAQVAQLLHEKNETGRAMAVLNEAEKSIARLPNGVDRVITMLAIASAAAHLDPVRGFEAMKVAIEAINRSRKSDGTSAVAIRFDDFDGNLLLLARTDLNQALRLAKSLAVKETSILAQVAACRGALAHSSNHAPK